MNKTLATFNQLVDAEQYFEFFDLPYDPQIVNVNRLHILKKFANAIKELDAESTGLSEADKLEQYCTALKQAYSLFRTSNAIEQKLFKVFRDKPKNVVLLSDISV